MKLKINQALPLLLLLLAGCAALGVLPAKTFNEKAAAATISVTGARQTTLTLLQASKISPDDAENVQDQANNLRKGIDVARTIHETDATGGDTKLDATIQALQILTAYLEEHKK